ncbi:hypothetical protein Ahy_B09g095246 [Arachis hypogaea]|uniref:DUF223 domain-containing protein n=1 Tax=Arachis hypogaea TaxID=3818 RepID=A0A444XDB1_ARAHY|nr:hypothetical protein Ahy_B09g095246 [Arachis hypogaea]
MVVLDKEGNTIQCTVKDIFVPIFEGLLAEGNVYVVTNFGVALNTIKFKSTRHEFRIHFKRDTIVRPVSLPLKVTWSSSHGTKSRQNFVPLFTLQALLFLIRSFAFDLLKYLDKHPCLIYVVIFQMGKMKFYSGVMGVSNINYNLKLFINVEFSVAKDFFLQGTVYRSVLTISKFHKFLFKNARVNKLDHVDGQGIMPLVCDQPISVENDFLHLSVYKTIVEIKEHNQELEKRYFYSNCIKDYGFYVLRYIIHIRVIDHTDAASFVLFDGEAANFLGVSANDLRQCLGVEKNFCPKDIDMFRDIKFIFKVQLKMRNLNSYEPYGLLSHENSELLSLSTGPYNTSKICVK